ncbi:MAG TPA: hypothetical protein VMX97_04850 [Hyphomicrobiaceae bacterium]|nr:hypothetical protein [Hyphomicrobiaceae bacterium]
MKTATVRLSSVSPYSQSRAHETAKLDRETADLYDKRTWREHCHVTSDGNIFIPPMAFKMGLDKAATMLGRQIPGKGKATYTKFFLSGVLCSEPVVLDIKKADVVGERIYCNADGKRGSGKRVWRIFPTIPEWQAVVTYHVLANEITTEVFEDHLKQAGSFVGVGRFRPENGGYYGRFKVESVEWTEI